MLYTRTRKVIIQSLTPIIAVHRCSTCFLVTRDVQHFFHKEQAQRIEWVKIMFCRRLFGSWFGFQILPLLLCWQVRRLFHVVHHSSRPSVVSCCSVFSSCPAFCWKCFGVVVACGVLDRQQSDVWGRAHVRTGTPSTASQLRRQVRSCLSSPTTSLTPSRA